ncbi:ABC transporter substrate-binding protein [Thermomonospora cellulosilytica]|uniref:Putative aliphatic sulfonates-binding protein n=1 Tax=Thermomonospora cellulosilytica TaxID=1411118 RepID=A0A7W3MVY4_9ACTN|nr:ABC transporter substrate-binding protein [Thermomonospora cellulosilytica]MBA9002892.1 sulfonate transport system substrate-binding protein [Thermomonospora cellulosilytica]
MRRLTAALLAALTLVAAAACGGGDDGPSDISQVTLRVGDQKGSSLQSLLGAAGQLDGVPYKISWSLFTSGPPILEAVNAGAVDFGVVGNTPPVFSAAARSEIVIIGAVESKRDGQAIVVPKNSPLRSPAELRGRKIAVAKGSSAHYHLLSVLKRHGIAYGDVQPQYLQPADALTALTGGRIDAWATWEPYTAQAEIQTGARILADGNGYTNGYGFQITSRSALDNQAKTAALKDFLNRYRTALKWANTHHKEWAGRWAADTGLPVPVAERAHLRRFTEIIRVDDAVIAEEQRLADAFAEIGLIPGRFDFSGYFDRRFNDTVPSS